MLKVDFSTLVGQLRAEQLVSNPVELITYEMDATNNRGAPDGVAFPESTEDVHKIVRWARENGVPLVSRGGGTGLSGGAVAEQGGLIVSFTRMKRILEIDQVGGSVQVEPGIVNQVLDASVKQIVDTATRYDGQIEGPIPLPTEIKKYTVNRSSFIDKNSREQFEMRVHKRLIDISNPSPKLIESLTNINLPSGVNIDVKML